MTSSSDKNATASGVVTVPDSFVGYPLASFSIPGYYREDLDGVLLSEGILKDRTEKLAEDIFSSYPPGESIICVCVLKSAIGFFNTLMDRLQNLNLCVQVLCQPTPSTGGLNQQSTHNFAAVTHQLFFEFIRCKSYVDDQASGSVNITGISDIRATVVGKNILIVEDMIDTGETMKNMLEVFTKIGAKSVKVATLLRKRCANGSGYIPDFLGFEIPDRFVVGFSIDYNQHFRDLKHLCVVNDIGKSKYSTKDTTTA